MSEKIKRYRMADDSYDPALEWCASTDVSALEAENARLEKELKEYHEWPRCEECGGEITACGPMTIDGPEGDCLVCQLRSEINTLRLAKQPQQKEQKNG